ncbi:MAG TPA: penicillin-insensitive murein endopeptidase, partial [Hyphomicrobiaceae bacterium]|nr:penicillin-insensitive murein endopeptidase [Hyphomicrobiaceae bacterium]
MRLTSLLSALALAASVPLMVLAQEAGQSQSMVVAAAKAAKHKKAVPKKKTVKPAGPPAKLLFGAAKSPAPMGARAIGFYAKGCLAGATALPIDGPAWQAMRLSRNRNWGHPKLVALVEKLAVEAKAHDGWSGLLVGDLSQPRGGPMLTG